MKDWCTCHKNKEACTDFCGCGDECANNDVAIPETIDDDTEDFEDLDCETAIAT